MTSIARSSILVVMLIAGCGRERKPDCGAYADKHAALMAEGLDESRRGSVRFAAEDACRKGDVSAEQVACVMRATSAGDVRECSGLPRLGAPATTPPARAPAPEPLPATGPRVRASGFSVPLPDGWVADTAGLGPNELRLKDGRTADGIATGLYLALLPGEHAKLDDPAQCKRVGEIATAQGMRLESAEIVDGPSGRTCQTIASDGQTRHVGTGVRLGDNVLVATCSFAASASEPPPECLQVLRGAIAE